MHVEYNEGSLQREYRLQSYSCPSAVYKGQTSALQMNVTLCSERTHILFLYRVQVDISHCAALVTMG